LPASSPRSDGTDPNHSPTLRLYVIDREVRVKRIVVAVVVVALGLGSAVMTGVGASPATRNCGHLVVDHRGDAQEWFLPTKPYNAEADLLSVDAVTTASTVNFTLTMASVDAKPTTGTLVSIYFTVDHQGGKSDYEVSVNHQLDSTSYGWQNDDTQEVHPITGSTDPKAGTYVISVPRSDIAATYRGAMLKDLGVIVSQTAGANVANGGFIEQSTGPRFQYRVGYGYGCARK
jgi:hypothetical protein